VAEKILIQKAQAKQRVLQEVGLLLAEHLMHLPTDAQIGVKAIAIYIYFI